MSDSSLAAPVEQIYRQLQGLFSKGENDIFQLEFPARLLEEGNFLYQGSDTINAQQVKPPAVAEAEFRLSNDMYDVSNVVGGPNASKLSERYREILFSMIAANKADLSSSEKNLRDDQERICAWLEEEVDDFEVPLDDLLKGLPADLALRAKAPAKYKDVDKPPVVKAAVAGAIAAAKGKISRVDLYQKLLDVYNGERFRWIQFKNDARPKDFSKQTEVDAYDRLLTTYAPVIDSKLEALWTVLVIRGQYHRVRRYIAYVDVETASEALQRAKENLRSSVSRSIDDTEDVYPVVFTPSNWAKYLSTNFKSEDLLNQPYIVRNQLFAAEKSRALLMGRQNNIKAGQQDISKLKSAEDQARADLSKAQQEMTAGFGDAVVKLVQIYFDSKSKNTENPAEAVRKDDPATGMAVINKTIKDELKTSPLKEADYKKLQEMQAGCLEKQNLLMMRSEAFNRAQLAAAQARSKDGTNILSQLQEQIDSLTLDIDYYKKILSSMENPLDGPSVMPKSTDVKAPSTQSASPAIPDGDGKWKDKNGKRVDVDGWRTSDGTKFLDKDGNETNDPTKKVMGDFDPPVVRKTPVLPEQSDSASVWQEIVLTYKKSSSVSSSMSHSKVSHENWQTGFWFWSAGHSSDSAESEHSETHDAKNTDLSIAFRVMKVSINRPWMDAGILAKTKDFFRDSSRKIARMKPQEAKAALDRAPGTNSEEEMMPSFATGFVVAKDVHIVLHNDKAFSSQYVKDVQSSSSSGGGFLCFGTSKSSSSSDHREGAVVTTEGNDLSIKIPAPQIIGWICELTPQDVTETEYRQLPEDEFKSHLPKQQVNSLMVNGLMTPPADK